jgi:hypothetical protein
MDFLQRIELFRMPQYERSIEKAHGELHQYPTNGPCVAKTLISFALYTELRAIEMEVIGLNRPNLSPSPVDCASADL